MRPRTTPRGTPALATGACLLGYALLIGALLADPLGVGGQPGMGWRQSTGAIAGALMAAAGFTVLLRDPAGQRRRLMFAGTGAALVAAVLAADRLGAGRLELGSPHLYLAALGVLLVLLAGERG